MIRVDIAEIEKLTDVLARVASDTDEVLNRLRQISNEMYNDVELPTYPQSAIALEAVSGAVDALNRGNDTLQSLRSAVLPIASTYQETEKKNRDALSRMYAMMDSMGTSYNAAIISDSIVHVEHTDDVAIQGDVQRLVADSVEEMQVANIAAVTKAVKEEYDILKVEDFIEKK